MNTFALSCIFALQKKIKNTHAISLFPAAQPAGGPGEPAARSAPEDPAAPHGLHRPGVSGPQSPGRPVRGHPLAHTGLRSAAGSLKNKKRERRI